MFPVNKYAIIYVTVKEQLAITLHSNYLYSIATGTESDVLYSDNIK